MTRPQIVRADTLDLQDQTTPSASDHTHKPTQGGPVGPGHAAPHQQAALRRVSDELTTEEKRLSQQWLEAGILNEELDSDDERNHARANNLVDELAISQNGGQSGDEEDSADEGESDDMDDDMMDKVSSSPSIDDGGYSTPISLWPPRSSSLTPVPFPDYLPSSPPTQLTVSSPCNTSSLSIEIPEHPPLHLRESSLDLDSAPQSKASSIVSSPITAFSTPITPCTPQRSPLQHCLDSPSLAQDHHRAGEYIWTVPDPSTPSTCSTDDLKSANKLDDLEEEKRDILMPLPIGVHMHSCAPRRLRLTYHGSHVDVSSMLLPEDDPFLDNPQLAMESPELAQWIVPPLPGWVSPTNSDDSWATTSDQADDEQDDHADIEETRFLNDDDSQAVSLYTPFIRRKDAVCPCGDECLLYAEDIDFEFVYALHTFVATVEGQANAQKGDTMVLLDDSNSYWWLVRIVKDSSIGYLPAEHIETPTERLARLNKHRNIDLATTMLGDTAEKSKNPLKKAIRRRNAKSVHFAEATYVEPEVFDYSTEEEEDDEFAEHDDAGEDDSRAVAANDQDEISVEPLKLNGKKDGGADGAEGVEATTRSQEGAEGDPQAAQADESLDKQYDHSSKSRHGTVRNTDSFFKDESTETRKITLTPKMLRDDSSGSTVRSVDTKERAASIESLERTPSTDKVKDEKDRKKREKRDKDKKPGMLSGLFKRKDKKGKVVDNDSVDPERPSEDMSQSISSVNSADSSQGDRNSSLEGTSSPQPQRQTSKGKLQKAPRGESALRRTDSGAGNTEPAAKPYTGSIARPGEQERLEAASPAAVRVVSPDPSSRSVQQQQSQQLQSKPQQEEIQAQAEDLSRSNSRNLNPMSIFRSGTESDQQQRPEKTKKAKQRMVLDDFDSQSEEDAQNTQQSGPATGRQVEQDAGGDTVSAAAKEPQLRERLSESPVQITAADAASSTSSSGLPSSSVEQRNPPGLVGDTSSQETPDADDDDRAVSPVSPVSDSSPMLLPTQRMPGSLDSPPPSPTITPAAFPVAPSSATSAHPPAQLGQTSTLDISSPTEETFGIPRDTPTPSDGATTTATSTNATSTPQKSEPRFSPTHLRSYLDDSSDIRDMLLVVRDVRGVAPVGMDHPILDGLFTKEKGRCEELGRALDSMLVELVGRKKGSNGALGTTAIGATKVSASTGARTAGSKRR